MHNNIRQLGSQDRPPMLGPGRYTQGIRVLQPDTKTKENKLYLSKLKREAIFLICLVLGMKFTQRVDACTQLRDVTAIERLQQGIVERTRCKDQSISGNWEFTSRDRESMEEHETEIPHQVALTARDFGHYAKELQERKSVVKDYAVSQGEYDDCANKLNKLHGKRFGCLTAESSSTENAIGTVTYPESSHILLMIIMLIGNATEWSFERAALANLIANLTLDIEENKTILKQLKKANASLTQELKECKTNLDESSRALGRLSKHQGYVFDPL
ncbi:hypothetical protein Tco_0890206 [Tanacetum coccineum]|uniref:Uncharacterized protein n=1 Tax=Tanacetum coccineum TaxID=301880 RepID=A0ABQ5C175_9ASTR